MSWILEEMIQDHVPLKTRQAQRRRRKKAISCWAWQENPGSARVSCLHFPELWACQATAQTPIIGVGLLFAAVGVLFFGLAPALFCSSARPSFWSGPAVLFRFSVFPALIWQHFLAFRLAAPLPLFSCSDCPLLRLCFCASLLLTFFRISGLLFASAFSVRSASSLFQLV